MRRTGPDISRDKYSLRVGLPVSIGFNVAAIIECHDALEIVAHRIESCVDQDAVDWQRFRVSA